MRGVRRALARLAALVRGHERADVELRAEMEAHLEMDIEERIRRGVSPQEARRQALIAAGGMAQAAERAREQRGLPWVENLAADSRYAVRHFRRTPLATGAVILVLALGIGTNVVLFTVLNSLATAPAAGLERDASLVRIRGTVRAEGLGGAQPRLLSWPEVAAYAGRDDLFGGVAAYADETAVLDGAGASEGVARVIYATANYHGVLGVQPALGRVPVSEAGSPHLTGPPTAMISYALWQQSFGGGADVIGRTLRLNEVPVEIVGVAPPRFVGTEGAGSRTLWLPLGAYPLIQKRTSAAFLSADSLFLAAAARLSPGVTAAAATAAVAGISERVYAAGHGTEAGITAGRPTVGADVVPMLASNSHVGGEADLLFSGIAAGGLALLVLLITCTNVSGLLVGLGVARRREVALRVSLGAPRGRLVRQLLTESVLLALMGAAVALLTTLVGLRLMGAAVGDLPLAVDARVTLATIGIALMTGLLFGISPALHVTRTSVAEALKGSSPGVSRGSRLQRALVVGQIALTQPLLVGLGIVVATMATDLDDRGASGVPEQIAEIELDTWASRISAEERAARIAAAVERVAAMPGVIEALPMQAGTIGAPLTVHPDDRVPGVEDRVLDAVLTAAPEGYFDAFGIPLLRGRAFDDAEYAQAHTDPLRPISTDAVVIGSDVASRLWGGADPIGRRLLIPGSNRPDGAMVVVGVVDEAAAGRGTTDRQVRVYVPYASVYSGLIARTDGPAQPLLGGLRRLVAAEAPQLPIVRGETMAQRERREHRDLLRTSGAVAAGGLLALILSAFGLYALMALVVGLRTREIGIRTALGARSGQVVGTFFRQGLVLGATGLALGLPLSLVATRWIAASVDWPLTTSPLLGIGVAAVVLLVTAGAAWLPARRASRVDPLLALRAD